MCENEFEIILDNDEEIIKTIKPNKKRFVTINIIFTVIFFGLLIVLFLGIGLGGYYSDEAVNGGMLAGLGSIAGILFIIAFIGSISSFVTYKKTIYAVTNKRVIIKSGFIGNDFKSLDLDSIGAISVRVDFLDKIIRPINTGTLDFGSMSMPMNGGTSGQGGNAYFSFKHIDNPYDVYKETKEYINQAKNKQ